MAVDPSKVRKIPGATIKGQVERLTVEAADLVVVPPAAPPRRLRRVDEQDR